MGNPILIVTDTPAGLPTAQAETTPPCPEAKFKVGDVVLVRRRKHLLALPERAAIAVVVPPGFSATWALADARRQARPHICAVPSRGVTYIVGFDGNPTPHLLSECDLKPSGEDPVEVKWQS